MDDRQALIQSLTENLQRNNLEPEEIGSSVHMLRHEPFNMTQERTGNPDMPTAIRCLVLTPTGKALKVAERRKFGIKGKAEMKLR